MKKLSYIVGDIFKSFLNQDRAILHQCNTCGVMGAGIARIISRDYPGAYKADLQFRSNIIKKNNLKNASYYPVKEMLGLYSTYSENELEIANLYGQLEPGFSPDFKNLLYAMEDYLIESRNKDVFLIPYKIGCGLAGGNWNVLEEKLVDVLSSIMDDKGVLLIDKTFVVVLPEFAGEIENK